MSEAESGLGEGNADSAVDLQGARSMPCARARRVWRNRCSSRWDKVPVPAAAAGSATRARRRTPSAWPSAARARIRRRQHGEGAGRDRHPARTPHHRGVALPLRRRAASAGGVRLHRAALEGLLSNATSRTSSRAPARLPASEILLLGVAAEFQCVRLAHRRDGEDAHGARRI